MSYHIETLLSDLTSLSIFYSISRSGQLTTLIAFADLVLHKSLTRSPRGLLGEVNASISIKKVIPPIPHTSTEKSSPWPLINVHFFHPPPHPLTYLALPSVDRFNRPKSLFHNRKGGGRGGSSSSSSFAARRQYSQPKAP